MTVRRSTRLLIVILGTGVLCGLVVVGGLLLRGELVEARAVLFLVNQGGDTRANYEAAELARLKVLSYERLVNSDEFESALSSHGARFVDVSAVESAPGLLVVRATAKSESNALATARNAVSEVIRDSNLVEDLGRPQSVRFKVASQPAVDSGSMPRDSLKAGGAAFCGGCVVCVVAVRRRMDEDAEYIEAGVGSA